MYIKYSGANIYYTVSGSGKTVVLIHGFTESSDIWNYFSGNISKHYQVICIDLPGHGRSGCIGDIHTMDAMADVVKEILNNAHIEICTMIGHSMGGYVTLAFADKYPESLNGFGLFHSSASADSDEARIKRSRAIEIIRNNHHDFLTSFIPDLFTPESRKIYHKEIEELIATAKAMTKESVIAAQEGMKNRPLRYHVLKDTNLPVLFIAGHKDSRISIKKIIEQIALPKETHILFLQDVSHMGFIESKEKTLQFLISFLNSLKKKN